MEYLDYVMGVLQGDLGKSIQFSEPVAGILAQALPWTLFVLTGASLLTFMSGILLGAVQAYYEGGEFDSGATLFNLTFHAIPYFVIAALMLIIVGFKLEWLPTGGRYDQTAVTPGFNLPFMVSATKHAILPVLSLIITGFGGGALQMRGNSIRVLGEDYIRVARLRGLSDRRIALRYVMRNSVLPMYTGFMISLGSLFGGSVILERIFQYPGIGYYTIQGFVTRDYPLIMGGFILTTVVVVIGILIADLTYGLLDPRATTGDMESY